MALETAVSFQNYQRIQARVAADLKVAAPDLAPEQADAQASRLLTLGWIDIDYMLGEEQATSAARKESDPTAGHGTDQAVDEAVPLAEIVAPDSGAEADSGA